MVNKIFRLADTRDRYDAVLCDVWGVLHNGVESWPEAVEALRSFRRDGGIAVLITNSPRPNNGVREQLAGLGVDPDSYDDIVTSGDVTRSLIEAGPREIHYIGNETSAALLDGLDVHMVAVEDAGSVVCAGLVDDETEQADDYRPVLRKALERNLPLVCANPDIVVERGNRLIPCAGAVAALYEEMGGRTLVAGKPHTPIYEAAIERVRRLRGEVDKNRVVAVGDGMLTDVTGARDFGLDLIYVAMGIHAHDYCGPSGLDEERLDAFLENHGAHPVGWMNRLR